MVTLAGMEMPPPPKPLIHLAAPEATTARAVPGALGIAPGWVVHTMVAQAIANALDSGTRVAVMLFGFAPSGPGTQTLLQGPEGIRIHAQRIGQRPDEWAPMPVGEQSSLVVAGSFGSRGAAIDRARELLAAARADCRSTDPASARGCVVGIAIFPEDGNTAQSLLLRAQAALAKLRLLHRDSNTLHPLRPHRAGAPERPSGALAARDPNVP